MATFTPEHASVNVSQHYLLCFYRPRICTKHFTAAGIVDGQSQNVCIQVGLSTIAEKVLGKPLDKSMQLSDWEQRPLSERQMRCEAHNFSEKIE